MWDDSLPTYTGSFSDILLLISLYIKAFIYYLVVILGLISILLLCILPIFGSVFAYKFVKIKFKKHKKHKKDKKKIENNKKIQQESYISKLDKKIKKKK